ncbi:type II toxin-antitoxin system HicA family toxin [Imperialibacter roseus]|uniref:Type II toxin-antitoxin system HicA family toxin n=1 Tax=Imperialibacter roseus TaxID=1324217 RepID=A0ABZ0IWN2_9BACT|nr:type II toxin-antitoxin system HicA family toxin [Imperialibacter roseus]WOK09453.1 type II toxin-antitoxin system HicA family toxin [Imperialibacter roseus]|tara:strand:+ start:65553 stop:65744 length:192 start_codon:yes stop_codon:yes gene_type:complete
MPDYSSNGIIKKLLEVGFTLDRVKGSHHIYKNREGKRVVVPHPKKDLPKGTFNSILRQAGLQR